MNVYYRDQFEGLFLLGTTLDRVPTPPVGSWFTVEVPCPPPLKGGFPSGHRVVSFTRYTYRIGIDPTGKAAVMIDPGSCPPRFLPGWSPADDGLTIHQASRS